MKSKRPPQVPWTAGEDALIGRLRNRQLDYESIAEKLPERTAFAVKGRVAYLISVGRLASQREAWTTEEDALICEFRARNVSVAGIAPHLEGRTRAAIARRIQQLRLEGRIGDLRTPPENRSRWTDAEEAVIVELRERGATVDEIASALPHRTRAAVEVRVRELLEAEEVERAPNAPHSFRAWSTEEDELVTVMRRASKSVDEIATALRRSPDSVDSRIKKRVRRGELELVRVTAAGSNDDHRREQRRLRATGAAERAGRPPMSSDLTDPRRRRC